MANSRKSNSSGLPHRIAALLEPILPAHSRLLVGLSGGVDSVVLLYLLHQLSPQYSWRLSALHVHHGISPHADAWAMSCAELCQQLDIPLQVERVDITPLRHMGIEAAARELRHAALVAQPVDYIALAHHRDDQAETMLLQLLRGAGVKGAAAMPLIKRRSAAPTLLRPLLGVSRAELVEYAQQQGLKWVEDESNADDSYPRNFLRQRVMPLLAQRFPACSETLARSAHYFAEASDLLDQLAQLDAQHAVQGDTLDLVCLQGLDAARARNLLRYFIASRGAPMPDSTRLLEIQQQICHARKDAEPCIAFGGWEVRRYQDKVYVIPVLSPPDAAWHMQWHGEHELALPQLGGTLYFEPCAGQGLSLQKLQQGVVTVRLRQGAERVRLDARRPVRTLKNLLQEHAIPPWRRDILPLLFCDEELAAIPGVGVACAYQAAHEENGVCLVWRNDKFVAFLNSRGCAH